MNPTVFYSAIFLLFALRFYSAATLELSPDEAYYWTWSEQLASGYFDHPPAIAFLVRIGTEIVGKSELGVRLGSLAAGISSTALIAGIASRLAGTQWAGQGAALLMAALPLSIVGGTLATPDAPLVLGWSLALWGLSEVPRSIWSQITAMSLGSALAVNSKNTGWLIALHLLTIAVVSANFRSRYRGRPLIVGIGIFLGGILPNLYWNYQHQWITYRFQLNHVRGDAIQLDRFFEFLAGQFGALGIVTAIWSGVAIGGFLRRQIRGLTWHLTGHKLPHATPHRSNEAGSCLVALLVMSCIPLWVLGAGAACLGRTEVNWVGPAYLGILALSHTMEPRLWKLAWSSAVFCSLLLLLQVHSDALSLLGIKDPSAVVFGWKALAQTVHSYHGESSEPIFTDRYQEAAELDFYLPGTQFTNEPRSGALQNRGRMDQYDLWPNRIPREQAAWWLTRAGEGSGPPWVGAISDGPITIRVGRGTHLRSYHLYRVVPNLVRDNLP